MLSRKKSERLKHKLRGVEKRDRMLIKDRAADRMVLEEVFDKLTLKVIYSLLNQGIITSMYGVVKSGKEARIYRGIDSEGQNVAIKIYLTVASEFRRMRPYLEGDVRFKSVKRDTRSLIYAWAQKEYKNLKRAYSAGIRVPKPIHVEKNVLLMEFIGEGDSPAPTLREKPPKNMVKARNMYKALMYDVKALHNKARLIHGDLSEYNIFNYEGIHIIFDMAQAVFVQHPRAEELLQRDLRNINRFFDKFDLQVRRLETLFDWILRG